MRELLLKLRAASLTDLHSCEWMNASFPTRDLLASWLFVCYFETIIKLNWKLYLSHPCTIKIEHTCLCFCVSSWQQWPCDFTCNLAFCDNCHMRRHLVRSWNSFASFAFVAGPVATEEQLMFPRKFCLRKQKSKACGEKNCEQKWTANNT